MIRSASICPVITLFFLISLGNIQHTLAQTGAIRGVVVDGQTNESLIGASIMIEGTTKGAVTDMDGAYAIPSLTPGTYTIRVTYISYVTLTKEVVVESGETTVVDVSMKSTDTMFGDVVVIGRANRQSEAVLLKEQKMALLSTQAVGVKEMARKGFGDAEAAIAHLSGVTKQEGVKNVFVRGLGDRYNATTLNGFPLPSEDPEYKNIALSFFTSDMIQHIGVNKAFSSSISGDVGGALININSKNLVGDNALGADVTAGINASVLTTDFLKLDGSDVLGFAHTGKPAANTATFQNSLNPSVVDQPVNQSYAVSGGKRFELGTAKNPLSFFIVAAYETDYAYTKENVRNTTNAGTVYQDQTGEKYSQTINQLLLANIEHSISKKHHLAYNMMMLHVNDQYVGRYSGMNGETYQDADESGYVGHLIRQQTNDNLLFVNQLITDWKLTARSTLHAGVAYNTIKGLEPDRRENNLSKRDGTYIFTGSNRQKRFFSELRNNDITLKTSVDYALNDAYESGNSNINVGYEGRFVLDQFKAIEYNFSAYPGNYALNELNLDNLYNQTNYTNGLYTMVLGDPNEYDVSKYINAGFAEANYQVSPKLASNLGLRAEYVDLTVNHRIQSANPGSQSINNLYLLPHVNVKYEADEKNTLRLGLSKTYTIPQSKEISPYQYVNIGFVSQGNANLKPSDNYNADLKWDHYLSPAEVISLNGFYKHLSNPIGRVNEGNSAGLLTYRNISRSAMVAGIEFEARKNLFNCVNERLQTNHRLVLGFNASYMLMDLTLDVINTTPRKTNLEGASPFITNIDLSYTNAAFERSMLVSLVFNYYSDRIHTLGAMGYNDIIDKAVPTINLVSSYKWNKHFSVKLKASNLLDPAYRLTRKDNQGKALVLNEYHKGMSINLGLSYTL
ncbi:MAG: TonB-dependent receptor [Bacteroidales bacterium]|nr:TonB-dependent receptor [Bacteroidales bacterium]